MISEEALVLVREINRKMGMDTVVLGSDMAVPGRFTTGSLSLDVALGGGWPANQWVEIMGHECLCPGTKILCADLIWRPIEELHLGQEIIGFDEQSWNLGRGRTSCYRRAEVTDLGRKTLPVYEITTAYGTTLASAGHLWLAHAAGSRTAGQHSVQRHWLRTDQVRPGTKISSLGQPWQTDRSWEAGWLSGFYDGEGSVGSNGDGGQRGARVTCAQAVGPVADLAFQLLEKLGFTVWACPRKRPADKPHWKEQVAWRLGGRYEDMRFLGSVRPERLLSRSHLLWENRSTKSVHASTVTVQSVRYLGEREVVTIGTSTQTLIADGMLSHNSAGKTMTAVKTIAANQQLDPEYTTFWLAAEHYDEQQATALGVDNSRVIVSPTQDMEKALDLVVQATQSRACHCIVLDSYPALIPDEESEKKMGENVVGVHARLFNKFLRKLGAASHRDIRGSEPAFHGMIINQYREKIGAYGDPKTTPGGNGKNYFFYARVEVKRLEYITEKRPGLVDPVKVGQSVRYTTIKNKSAAPQQRAKVDYYFRGAPFLGFRRGDYDLGKEYVEMGLLFKVINGSPSWPRYRGEKYHGKTALMTAIREDIELKNQLRTDVMEVARDPNLVDQITQEQQDAVEEEE